MRVKLCLIFILASNILPAQHVLHPGFDAWEYAKLLSVTGYRSNTADSLKLNALKNPFRLAYRSQETGMKNQWTLYTNENEKTAIISIRGTVASDTSWMENYYFAMIPATGTLEIAPGTSFHYKLAERSEAAVHAGWTIALAFMANDMEEKIRELYHKGIKDFYIFGHSQGGAIAYLLRSYLHYRRQDGALPEGIVFKTYCSAAPKPGNMSYVYDYDFINRGSWAFTIVNAVDWVPESPYTVQTMKDMYPLNPLTEMGEGLKNEKLFKRIVGKYLYARVEKKTRRTQQMLTRFFGDKIYKYAIRKAVSGLQEPEYVSTVNYMRAGTPVVLMPDSSYFKVFDEAKKRK